MAIIIKDTESLPALVYDRIFLDSLEIQQEKETNNGVQPLYKVKVSYRIYAVGEENKRYFKPGLYTIYLPDYVTKAMEKAARGDMDMLTVMQSIQQALALLIEDEGEHSIAGVQ